MFHTPQHKNVICIEQGEGVKGFFKVQRFEKMRPVIFTVVASDGQGWEHVSVSTPGRCPTWDEMCFIKDLFWDEEDTVIQFHPPKSEYVNNHPNCLHLWRKVGENMKTPPKFLTGL